ncbi:MAG: hypothetical protein O2992_01900 [Gemmatimonadetes bacterium]|nr:hypothetical protein [Gemmatimonadota bacterium]
MRIRRSLLSAFLVPLLVAPLHAQVTADQFAAATSVLKWREVGPTIMSGRVSDLAVVESDPRIFYVGTATGGLWKTMNAGITFDAIFTDQATSSIGDVTVAPSNPNVVWVGSGEPQNRQSSPWGNGVYRSVDAGRTWKHLGLENTHHISRIQVHPRDPDVAYVAAVGHLWGPNSERGVYKTVDGGQSWDQVLFLDENTGTIDLVMDPNDPQTLFAAMYQRQRRAWGYNGGGPGSGIYRSHDGGESWEEVTEGLPSGDKGRIGLDIYRRDGNIVCAIVEADARAPGRGFGGDQGGGENGVYCSEDRGDSWEKRSDTNNRPMYYSQIRIDPNDPERIYTGGSDMFRSSDGGRTFTNDAAAGVHLDHHAIWVDPSDSDHLLLGSDGGVSVSWDRSDNWYQFRNLPISQMYEIGVDMRDPYHVCGGLQDNGSWCAPSDTWSNQGIRTRDWYNVGSGDGFFTVMHPTDPTVMFAESQGGNITRVDLTTNERARIRPEGRPDADGQEPDLRWNWDSPVQFSSHDASTLFVGSNMLFKSTDMGQSWEAISPDLTYAVDRETLEIMGVLGSEAQISINDGQSSYGNLTAIGESPVDAGLIYTGSDDGRLQVTQDGGATWTDLTAHVRGLPANTYVTRIVVSHADAATVYAAFDGHRSDDYATYVYKSTNFGADWSLITKGLPMSSVNALAQHPSNPDVLFVGNEVGIYASTDAGASWMSLQRDLPTVPVDDIKIHPRDNDLVIGTHGRGIWIMDDIGVLEELTAAAVVAPAHLFNVRRATSYNSYNPQGWTPGIFVADNPEMGARIRYHLAAESDDVALTIMDPMGSTVRELSPSGTAGLNEVLWDLRLQADGTDGEIMEPGPRVMPGTYLVRLEAGDAVIEGEVSVRLDPRTSMSRAVITARHAAMMESYRLSGAVEEANEALASVSSQLTAIDEMLEESADESEALEDEVAAVRTAVESIREDLGDAAGGAGVWGRIQGVSGPASADALWAIDASWTNLPGVINRLNTLLSGDVGGLYRRAYQDATRPAVPDSVGMPSRGG